jgi:uncharacterized protein YjiS (DUF1127 family)
MKLITEGTYMNNIKNSGFFKAISLILIVTFISLDVAYAYPLEHDPINSTLAVPSILQQQPINEQVARSRQSVFSQCALLASFFDIGEYFFGSPERKMGSLPSRYAEEVVSAGLGQVLDNAGIEILNIVPVEYLKKTAPEKLESALNEIAFKGTMPDEGVVFVLYKKDGKKFLVQIAEKARVSAGNLPGYDWVASDKYVVKYMPEGYEEEKIQSTVPQPVIVRPVKQAEAISPSDVAKEEPKPSVRGSSGKLYSFDPFTAAFSAYAAFSFMSWFNSLFLEDQIVAVMGALCIGTAAFFAIWRLFFPINWHMKHRNSYALAKMGSRAVPALIRALSSYSWRRRHTAVKALSRIDDPRIMESLKKLSNSKDEYIRNAALKVLNKKKDSRAKYSHIYSVDPFIAIFGASVLGSIFSVAKDFAFAHPIVTGIAALLIGVNLFLTIWRKFSPVAPDEDKDLFAQKISETTIGKVQGSQYPSEIGSEKTVETTGTREPKDVNAATQLFELVESSRNNEKKNLDQFETDSAIASLIALARKAKREDQKLIIGLETDWIPGMSVDNSLQRQAITALVKEIDGIAETLRFMGLDNLEIIRGSGDKLASAVLSEADKTHTNLRNIVVMASTMTINSNAFMPLREADEDDRPFLAGIDPAELIRLYAEFGESVSKQLYIRLAGLLYLTLDLAAGKEPPQTPMIASYDRKKRIVIFLPRAEPMDYELLKNKYTAEKIALQAA